MPIKKSAFKALRKAKKATIRNKFIKAQLKRAVKETRAAAAKKDQNLAKEKFMLAIKKLDRAASKGIIKKNTASRYKSKLAKLANAV